MTSHHTRLVTSLLAGLLSAPLAAADDSGWLDPLRRGQWREAIEEAGRQVQPPPESRPKDRPARRAREATAKRAPQVQQRERRRAQPSSPPREAAKEMRRRAAAPPTTGEMRRDERATERRRQFESRQRTR